MPKPPKDYRRFEKIGVIKEVHSLRVSSRGSGYCFYIPEGIMSLYGLLTGDMVKLEFRDHFRRKRDEDEEQTAKKKGKEELEEF